MTTETVPPDTITEYCYATVGGNFCFPEGHPTIDVLEAQGEQPYGTNVVPVATTPPQVCYALIGGTYCAPVGSPEADQLAAAEQREVETHPGLEVSGPQYSQAERLDVPTSDPYPQASHSVDQLVPQVVETTVGVAPESVATELPVTGAAETGIMLAVAVGLTAVGLFCRRLAR